METRREYKRSGFIDGANIKIFDLASARIIGRIENMNCSGLLLCSDRVLEINKTFRMSLSLPETINGKSVIRFLARSLWGDEIGTLWENEPNPASRFWTGFEILGLTEDDAKTVDALIAQFGRPGG